VLDPDSPPLDVVTPADRVADAEVQIGLERLDEAEEELLAALRGADAAGECVFLRTYSDDVALLSLGEPARPDEAALARAIEEKQLRAGLDVFQNEPAGPSADFGNPIVQAPGVYGTHHIGASTDQAQVAIAHEVIRIVQAFGETGEVPNVVNRLARSSASHVLSIRHRNRPGVLAHVFAVLAEAAINVEEVENIIYHGAQATLARIHLDGEPNHGALDRIRGGNPDIISVELSKI